VNQNRICKSVTGAFLLRKAGPGAEGHRIMAELVEGDDSKRQPTSLAFM
jgi:hypothetical protein